MRDPKTDGICKIGWLDRTIILLFNLVMVLLLTGCEKDQNLSPLGQGIAYEEHRKLKDQEMTLPPSVNKRSSTLREFLAKHMERAAKQLGLSIEEESMVLACPPEGLVVVAKIEGIEPSHLLYLHGPASPDPGIAAGLLVHVIFVLEPSGIRYVSLRNLVGNEMYRLPIFSSPRNRFPVALSICTGLPNPYGDNTADDPYVCIDDGENGTYYLDFTDLSCQQSPTGEPVCEQ